MRFKKGSKVEVLNKTEVPSGSWRCGEIISGNGHNYSVRYDCSSGLTSEAVVERVSRKTIRPSPPLVDGVKSWMVGDVVEVFNDFCWKIARVLTLIGGGCYFVRLLGSRQELSIHKSNIRLRQSWQDDKWVVIGKGPSTSRDVRFNMPPTVNCYQKSFLELPADTKRKEAPAGECLALWHNAGLASKFLEGASSYRSTHFEAYGGNSRKRRVIETEARRQRVFPASPLGKVDAVAHPGKNLGEKYVHASFNKQTIGYYEFERRKENGVVECSLAGKLEANDSNSDACSVGNSSVASNSPNKSSSCFLVGTSRDTDALCSDAESSSSKVIKEEKCPFRSKEELAAGVHMLGLHSYRNTLEALYASGPLSWEQEAVLTNLRLSLNISNDEHSRELRNLISFGTSPHISYM
ncbi:uncharacterized protein LOC131151859 [Malania oleifera]|uniref:uncharacterized protein LOC131151859 n=1 Tax=Malania oleifera TaxID=397392 RepID=UPI0025AD9D81|nr:uncharacterized protein LOC131151859 [Malania oleifera]XP_057959294.1 uncharacterized protein LOC131151859 [Malania oleifera]